MYYNSKGDDKKDVTPSSSLIKTASSTTQPKEKWGGTKVGELNQAFFQGGKPLDDLWITTTDVIGKTLASKPDSKSKTVYLTDWFQSRTNTKKKLVSRQTFFKGSYVYFIPKDENGKITGEPIKLVKVDYTLDIMPDGSFRPMYNSSDTFRSGSDKPAYFLYEEVAPAYQTILKNPRGINEFAIALAKKRTGVTPEALASQFTGLDDIRNEMNKYGYDGEFSADGEDYSNGIGDWFRKWREKRQAKRLPKLAPPLPSNFPKPPQFANLPKPPVPDFVKNLPKPPVPSFFKGLFGADGMITDMGADGKYQYNRSNLFYSSANGMEMELSNMEDLDDSISNAMGMELDLGADGDYSYAGGYTQMMAREQAPKIVRTDTSWKRKGSFEKGDVRTLKDTRVIKFYCPHRKEWVTRRLFIFTDGTASTPPKWEKISNASGENPYCEVTRKDDVRKCDVTYANEVTKDKQMALNNHKICTANALEKYKKCRGKSGADGDLDFDGDYANFTNESLLDGLTENTSLLNADGYNAYSSQDGEYSNLTNQSLLDGLTENTSMLEMSGGTSNTTKQQYTNLGFADTFEQYINPIFGNVRFRSKGLLSPNKVKTFKRFLLNARIDGYDRADLIFFDDKTIGLKSEWSKFTDSQQKFASNFEGDYSNLTNQSLLDGLTENTSFLEAEGDYSNFSIIDSAVGYFTNKDEDDLEEVKDNLGKRARVYTKNGNISRVAYQLSKDAVAEFSLFRYKNKENNIRTAGRVALYRIKPDNTGSMLINDGSWDNGGEKITLSATGRLLDGNVFENIKSMGEDGELLAFYNKYIKPKQKSKSGGTTKAGVSTGTKKRMFKFTAKKDTPYLIIQNTSLDVVTGVTPANLAMRKDEDGNKVMIRKGESFISPLEIITSSNGKKIAILGRDRQLNKNFAGLTSDFEIVEMSYPKNNLPDIPDSRASADGEEYSNGTGFWGRLFGKSDDKKTDDKSSAPVVQGDAQVVDGATMDKAYAESGAKEGGKSFKDWFKGEGAKNVLNTALQVANMFLQPKTTDRTTTDGTGGTGGTTTTTTGGGSGDVVTGGGSGDVVTGGGGSGGTDDKDKNKDKKFLGMPKTVGITVAVVGGLALIVGGVLIVKKMSKK